MIITSPAQSTILELNQPPLVRWARDMLIDYPWEDGSDLEHVKTLVDIILDPDYATQSLGKLLSADESSHTLAFLQRALTQLSSAELSTALSQRERGTARLQIIRLVITIAPYCTELPQSLFVHDVTLYSRDPCGLGGFADVYKGTYGGRDVAVKRLRIVANQQDREAIHRRLQREAIVWRQLDHESILPFIGVEKDIFQEGNFLCLVSLWMKNGGLLDYLEHQKPDISETLRLLTEIASGLAYLHRHNIVHGDIRCCNTLIDDDGHARLSDFGLAGVSETSKGVAGTVTNKAGSIRWMAPELHVPEQFNLNKFGRTRASDIYAFGCTCLEIFTREVPFSKIKYQTRVVFDVVNHKRPQKPTRDECGGQSIDEIWPLIEQCWRSDPAERPTAEAAVAYLRALRVT